MQGETKTRIQVDGIDVPRFSERREVAKLAQNMVAAHGVTEVKAGGLSSGWCSDLDLVALRIARKQPNLTAATAHLGIDLQVF